MSDKDRILRHVRERQESSAAHYRLARETAADGRLELAGVIQRYAARKSAAARELYAAVP